MKILKTKISGFRTTPAERLLLEELAKSQNLCVSKFLRKVAFQDHPINQKTA